MESAFCTKCLRRRAMPLMMAQSTCHFFFFSIFFDFLPTARLLPFRRPSTRPQTVATALARLPTSRRAFGAF